jgi:hypothetical protein
VVNLISMKQEEQHTGLNFAPNLAPNFAEWAAAALHGSQLSIITVGLAGKFAGGIPLGAMS